MIGDLPDERRAGKVGLPDDDRDVTAGRVVEGSWEWEGKPDCAVHGAMNRVDKFRAEDGSWTYRCMMCGVGAKWWPPGWISSDLGPVNEDEQPREPVPDYFGRGGRQAKNEEIEQFLDAWFVADGNDEIDLDRLPGYRFTLHHELVVRFTWSEWFRYPDGVLEQKTSFEDDPIGFAIDAYLEPTHDDDEFTVQHLETRVEYDPDEEFGGEDRDGG